MYKPKKKVVLPEPPNQQQSQNLLNHQTREPLAQIIKEGADERLKLEQEQHISKLVLVFKY